MHLGDMERKKQEFKKKKKTSLQDRTNILLGLINVYIFNFSSYFLKLWYKGLQRADTFKCLSFSPEEADTTLFFPVSSEQPTRWSGIKSSHFVQILHLFRNTGQNLQLLPGCVFEAFTANLLEGKQRNVCLKNVSTAFSLEPCWKTLEIWLTLPYFSSIRHILAQKIYPEILFFQAFWAEFKLLKQPQLLCKIALYEDTCCGSSGWQWQKSTSYLPYFGGGGCCCCCCRATTGLTVTADAQQEECPPPPSDKFWQL